MTYDSFINKFKKKVPQNQQDHLESFLERSKIRKVSDVPVTPRQVADLISELVTDDYDIFRSDLKLLLLLLDNRVMSGDIHSKRFLPREEILNLMERLPNNRDKALFLSAYEGISGDKFKEMINLKPEDLYENSIYIESRDAEIPVSKELMDLYKKCLDDTEITFLTNKKSEGRIVRLKDNGTVLKATETGNLTPRTLQVRFERILEYLGLREFYTFKDIELMGRMQFLMNKAKSENTSVYFIISDKKLDDFLKQFNLESVNITRMRESFRSYGLDFNQKLD